MISYPNLIIICCTYVSIYQTVPYKLLHVNNNNNDDNECFSSLANYLGGFKSP
jgi:hypothetical protein